MKILEFDKKSTFGLLRNDAEKEYYFVSGFQLLKIMLACKIIKTKVLSENEFHSLKKPQKYFIDNSKIFIFAFLGASILKKFLDTVNMYFFQNFERGNFLPTLYVMGLIIIIVLSKRNELKFKNNREKIVELCSTSPYCNNTKKRLRGLVCFYIFLNALALYVILKTPTDNNNFIFDLIGCIIPTYFMLLTLQDNDFKFVHEDTKISW